MPQENDAFTGIADVRGPEESAGRTLKKIFRQDGRIARIEAQVASSSLLMKPLRFSMFLHLCHRPCDHARSIARHMGVSQSSVKWNLDRMSSADYIQSEAVSGHRIYWPAGMIESPDLMLVSTARADWSQVILRALHENGGGARQRDIVARTGSCQQNADFWLKKMVSARILDKDMSPGHAIYAASPKFLERIMHYRACSREFSRLVLLVFGRDGLMPRRHRLRRSRLSVDIRLPSGIRRVHVECDPLAPTRRFISADKL